MLLLLLLLLMMMMLPFFGSPLLASKPEGWEADSGRLFVCVGVGDRRVGESIGRRIANYKNKLCAKFKAKVREEEEKPQARIPPTRKCVKMMRDNFPSVCNTTQPHICLSFYSNQVSTHASRTFTHRQRRAQSNPSARQSVALIIVIGLLPHSYIAPVSQR